VVQLFLGTILIAFYVNIAVVEIIKVLEMILQYRTSLQNVLENYLI
jgi:hypothetical protein